MNLPNALTLSRMAMAFFFLGCLVWGGFGGRLLATFFFLGASVTDGIDGWLARRRGAVTDVGKLIDPLADKLLTSLAFIALVMLEEVNGIWVIVIIGRDFFVTALRGLAGDRGAVIAASRLAKWKTALQMFAIVLALVHLDIEAWQARTGSGPVFPWSEAAIHSALNLMVGATALLALVSGVQYAWANRQALGRPA